MSNDKTALLERFMARVLVDEQSGCWEWQGARNKGGYGRWHDPELKRLALAYHSSWRLQGHSEVPKGYELDHLCVNPSCVNPAHLEPVTGAENRRRSRERRGLLHRCRQGHDMTDGSGNLYRKPNGTRVCMTCARRYRVKYNRKVRAARKAAMAA